MLLYLQAKVVAINPTKVTTTAKTVDVVVKVVTNKTKVTKVVPINPAKVEQKVYHEHDK